MQPYNTDNRGSFNYEDRTIPGDGMSERAFSSLLSEFFEQGQRLVRAEIALARTEFNQELTKVKAGGVMLGVGGVLLLLGGMLFAAFAVIALDLVMPLWLSALIVTVAFLGIGAGIANVGLKRMKTVHAPDQTIRTLKEDSQWASRTLKSMKSQMHGHA
jgi:O-antigen ligase